MKKITGLLLAPMLLAASTLAISAAEPAKTGVMVVSPSSQSQPTYLRNFNPFNATPLFPTTNGIYEPMMIDNKVTGETVPWLARAFKWEDGGKKLVFTLQDNVKWSDGEPMTASDVVFTFDLLAKTNGLQGAGLQAVGKSGYVKSVEAPDDKTVVFTFDHVHSPGFYDIIAQNIVPEHIWKDVEDPVKFTNDNPVGTGPFTEVTAFQSQSYQVDKNPYYWQTGKPYYNGMRMPAFGGNDAVSVAFANGTLDWAAQFFPNMQKAIIDKNPEDLHFWWPTVGADVLFMLNTKITPFDDVVVRKAVSLALNRKQMIQIALQGQSSESDVTALSSGYSAWKVKDPSTLGDWVDFDPARANKMLDEAGYKMGPDGIRLTPDGEPMVFDFTMVNGFTDWIAVTPVISQNLKKIGIKLEVVMADVPVAFGNWINGEYDVSMFFGIDASSPYTYYRNVMSAKTVAPIGSPTGFAENFWRYSSDKADQLLDEFAGTVDHDKQFAVMQELQKIMADEAPVIPMWHAPMFYEYNSARFTGWADADNAYTAPMPRQTTSDQLLLMTTVKAK
ncbi:ABC transporter substrate-binding protein [uncultured Cohaesibacter sp.]|uniref:ABC transporter substrate-binding protein n=1 Tax=uncultured Cohaesibacter sp. TaxID=1002546 RepID=UPI00293111A6|nr:ABC transporter substrate-binding protein [uncultured Cohaesibacter sp.]